MSSFDSQIDLEGEEHPVDARWRGIAVLESLLEPIENLQPHPDNPNIGNVEEIGKSLLRFGQVKPVVITEDRIIIAGHHVVLAARKLLWTHVAVVVGEFETAEDERAYLLADNELARLSEANPQLSLQVVKTIGDLEGTGISIDTLENWEAAAGMGAITTQHEWQAGETPEEQERRKEILAQQHRHIEYVLSLIDGSPEQKQFEVDVDLLMKHYAETSVTRSIVRAVNEVADGVRAG